MASDNLSTDRLPEILPPASSVPAPQRKSPERDMESGSRRRNPPDESRQDDSSGEMADVPNHELDRLV